MRINTRVAAVIGIVVGLAIVTGLRLYGRDRTYYVAATGVDSPWCGASRQTPCASVGGALRNAPKVLRGTLTVYVSAHDGGYPAFEVPQ